MSLFDFTVVTNVNTNYRYEVVVGNVPEPGTLGLLSFGLAGIAWVRRRKLV